MSKPSARPDKVFGLQILGHQFTKFVAAGGAGTALHYLTLTALVSQFAIPAGRAAFMGAVAGACVVYLLNRRYTFGTDRSHADTLPRFALMAMAGAVLNGVLVGMLTAAGLYFLLAQMLTTIVILIINFIVSKIWIFR